MPRPLNFTVRALCLVAVLFALPRRAAADSVPVAAAPVAAATAASTDSLTELIGQLEQEDALRARAQRALTSGKQLGRVEPRLLALELALKDALQTALDFDPSSATDEQLIDLQTALSDESVELDSLVDMLHDDSALTEQLQADLRAVNERAEGWAKLAKEQDAPPDVSARIDQSRHAVDSLLKQLGPRRNVSLTLLARATRLRARVTDIMAELPARRSRLGARLLDVDGPAIWHPRAFAALDRAALSREWSVRTRTLGKYLQANAVRLLLALVSSFLLALAVVQRAQSKLHESVVGTEFDISRTQRVLDHPVAAASLVGLLSLWFVGTGGPVSFYDAVFFFAPLPACRMCIAASGARVRWTCWALVAALALAPFRSLLELWPLGERISNQLELSLVLGALFFDWRASRKEDASAPRWVGALAALTSLVLIAALLQNTLGQIGWARTLRSGALGSLGLGMIYVSAFHALFGMGLVLLRTRLAGHSLLVRDWRHQVEVWLFRVLCFWAAFGMIVGPIFAFGLDDWIPKILDGTMTAQLHVGEVAMSVGSLVAAVLSLCGAWLMMGVVGALLEYEILPRFGFGQGVPYAIAALARYAVGLTGLLFALAAAGLDLSKITLLAGAVGVGVGFGLQNIVNNFVSGLILLIERPFHVGDMVEAPSANGIVRRIGIRASIIRTSQGADVIVPNGDLLSKALLNWTLSNRFRRIELEVGVTYGSDPTLVEKLLVESATENSAVRADPMPQALFVNFGDSALVFRLQAWVEDAGSALSASSQLRATILSKLSAAGIDMPFPQREVWLHEAKEASRLPVEREPGV